MNTILMVLVVSGFILYLPPIQYIISLLEGPSLSLIYGVGNMAAQIWK